MEITLHEILGLAILKMLEQKAKNTIKTEINMKSSYFRCNQKLLRHSNI